MKRAILILAAVALVTSLVAVDAEAGLFGKKKDKAEDKQIHRYDNFPSVSFSSGVLTRDVHTGWQLGDYNIQFVKGCQVDADEGVVAELREGSTARVMGPRFGDTILAYRVYIQKPDYMNLGNTSSSQVIWSDVDPTVGEGMGRNPE